MLILLHQHVVILMFVNSIKIYVNIIDYECPKSRKKRLTKPTIKIETNCLNDNFQLIKVIERLSQVLHLFFSVVKFLPNKCRCRNKKPVVDKICFFFYHYVMSLTFLENY